MNKDTRRYSVTTVILVLALILNILGHSLTQDTWLSRCDCVAIGALGLVALYL
jgi:hypothetical protein